MTFISKFKLNFMPIMAFTFKVLGFTFTIVAIILSFVSWEDIGINEVGIRLVIFIGICLFSFICCSLLVVQFFKRKRIWTKGKNSVFALYGDLIKIGFKTKDKKKKIIVIPVNDTFETIVESISESVNKPLVSPNTIHGLWVNTICSHMDITSDDLNSRIQENLKLQVYKPIKVYTLEEKSRGNLKSYSIGTVATIDGLNNCTFFLLVVSKFDSNNTAKSTKKNIGEAVVELLEYYDKKGQGDSLYIPLIGTGSSRAGLTHVQSLRKIKHFVLDSDKKINGKINLVVFNEDRDKVSIFK